jgi:UDP-N-acetyl-D-glucosamine dehydrogenase
MDLLKAQGAQLSYYDPHVPVIRITREHPHWAGTRSIAWSRETISQFDLVLISTAHRAVDYAQLGEWARCIVDTRNAMAPFTRLPPGRVWKA